MIRAISQLSMQQGPLARAVGALAHSLSAAAVAGATSRSLQSSPALLNTAKNVFPATSRLFSTADVGSTAMDVHGAPFNHKKIRHDLEGASAIQDGMPVHTPPSKDEKDYVLFHPVYTEEWVHNIRPQHKIPVEIHEKLGYAAVQVMRASFDLMTGYGPKMTEKQWLLRILFLETVAGVPGMVGGMLRHMRSLRTLRRDYGRIHTLLEEAENERMHLLTFMQMAKPGVFFRAAVLSAQGIFFNTFFLAYIISPRTAHAFVGYLEEEAVKTYTHALDAVETGKIPGWTNLPAPEISKAYWLLKDDATMKELLLAVRADEASHSHVNHIFSELGPDEMNPFVSIHYEDGSPKLKAPVAGVTPVLKLKADAEAL